MASLVAGVPVLTSGQSRGEHLAALVASNAEMATLARKVGQLAILFRQGSTQAAHEYRAMLDGVAHDVREHIRRVSAVLAELRPVRAEQISDSIARRSRCLNPQRSTASSSSGASASSIRATASSRWRLSRGWPATSRSEPPAIRSRIEATVVRRAPQVMVKVTGGGRGMKAIAAHFRYISKNGRLDIEDEHGRGLARTGKRCASSPRTGASAAP